MAQALSQFKAVPTRAVSRRWRVRSGLLALDAHSSFHSSRLSTSSLKTLRRTTTSGYPLRRAPVGGCHREIALLETFLWSILCRAGEDLFASICKLSDPVSECRSPMGVVRIRLSPALIRCQPHRSESAAGPLITCGGNQRGSYCEDSESDIDSGVSMRSSRADRPFAACTVEPFSLDSACSRCGSQSGRTLLCLGNLGRINEQGRQTSA